MTGRLFALGVLALALFGLGNIAVESVQLGHPARTAHSTHHSPEEEAHQVWALYLSYHDAADASGDNPAENFDRLKDARGKLQAEFTRLAANPAGLREVSSLLVSMPFDLLFSRGFTNENIVTTIKLDGAGRVTDIRFLSHNYRYDCKADLDFDISFGAKGAGFRSGCNKYADDDFEDWH